MLTSHVVLRLAVNPARGVKLPKRAPRHNVYLTASQLNRLADESGRYRSLVLLLGVGGLRWGEAAALRVRMSTSWAAATGRRECRPGGRGARSGRRRQ